MVILRHATRIQLTALDDKQCIFKCLQTVVFTWFVMEDYNGYYIDFISACLCTISVCVCVYVYVICPLNI